MTIKELGKMLKALRKKRGLTQGELAKSAGISQIYVAKIEAGDKIPSLPTLEKLAKVLKVKVGKLLE
jgi:transcriptional regulator with XRE-family HTH domain